MQTSKLEINRQFKLDLLHFHKYFQENTAKQGRNNKNNLF